MVDKLAVCGRVDSWDGCEEAWEEAWEPDLDSTSFGRLEQWECWLEEQAEACESRSDTLLHASAINSESRLAPRIEAAAPAVAAPPAAVVFGFFSMDLVGVGACSLESGDTRLLASPIPLPPVWLALPLTKVTREQPSMLLWLPCGEARAITEALE